MWGQRHPLNKITFFLSSTVVPRWNWCWCCTFSRRSHTCVGQVLCVPFSYFLPVLVNKTHLLCLLIIWKTTSLWERLFSVLGSKTLLFWFLIWEMFSIQKQPRIKILDILDIIIKLISYLSRMPFNKPSVSKKWQGK